ncbi:MAG: beta-glucosidase [Cyanobacteria bacterium RYN_339]|nr:beta-glucosidase [Cyanobacteria bacterium RYN_339]
MRQFRNVGAMALGVLTLLGAGGTAHAATVPIDTQVDRLLARMTLAEKVGQMTQLSEGGVVTGPGGTKGLEANIKAGNVGSVLNAVGAERIRKLQEIAVKQSRLKIPMLFGLDVIHGYKTIFPIPLAAACSWDMAAIERSCRVAATEAASDGCNWTFAPMVDIARDPRWGRIAEGAGEDVYLGQQVAQAQVRGFQGPDLKAPTSVVACVKHFAAYGAAQGGRDYNTVDLSRRTMLETYLPPYRAAFAAGARTAMSSFNEYDGVPATGNKWLLDDVLKQKWGFRGFVVSDWESVSEMIPHGAVADRKEAALLAANAGLQMEMQSGCYLQNLAGLVKAGKVSQAQVDDAVRRILRVKYEIGLFADPYRACDLARRGRTIMNKANLDAARDVSRRSIVLLKNDKDVLPLAAGKTVALVGPLADDRENMLGTWHCQADGKQCKSLADGLKERNIKVVTAKGCDIRGTDKSGFDAAVKAAKQADVVVAVLGEAHDMSGEASSRTNLNLPGVQRDLLMALKAAGKPIVLVAFNGRPLTLDWEQENLNAIVEAWHLGTQAGPAVADVLYGDYNPAGKLVATFPRTVGQIPLFYDHMNTGRPYNKDDHYTSQYMDAPNEPLYPFGYGLSYTKFQYSPLKLSTTALKPGGKLTVEVTIKNVGARDGEEVAQLYIRDLVGSVNRPVKQLKGFCKISIKKGEARHIKFQLTPRDLAFYRADLSYGAEAGQFKVWVGPSSATGSEGAFRLTSNVAVPD